MILKGTLANFAPYSMGSDNSFECTAEMEKFLCERLLDQSHPIPKDFKLFSHSVISKVPVPGKLLSVVISGIEAAVKTMKLGGVRRVIIPPSQGYQNTSQEPIPPDFFDRQRLFTTIFNPTRLANGEGSTLGTLVFDIELVSLRHL